MNEDVPTGAIAIDETVNVLHVKPFDGAANLFICFISALLAQPSELLRQRLNLFPILAVLHLQRVDLFGVLLRIVRDASASSMWYGFRRWFCPCSKSARLALTMEGQKDEVKCLDGGPAPLLKLTQRDCH